MTQQILTTHISQ